MQMEQRKGKGKNQVKLFPLGIALMGKGRKNAKHHLKTKERREKRDTLHPIPTVPIQILIPILQRLILILILNLIRICQVLPVMEGLGKGGQQGDVDPNMGKKEGMDERRGQEVGVIKNQGANLNGAQRVQVIQMQVQEAALAAPMRKKPDTLFLPVKPVTHQMLKISQHRILM